MSSSHSSTPHRRTSSVGEALGAYLKEISAYRLLTRDEEIDLARRIRAGDQIALDMLICSNLRFVVAVAKKYQNQGVSLDDLVNEGNVGLMRAARRFDETRGIKFISYAVWWIRQSIVESLADQSRIVRVPLSRVGELYQVGKCVSALQQELGRNPTNREIAGEMHVPESDVAETMRLSRGHLSLDAPATSDTDTTLLDLIADDGSDAPDEPILSDARTAAISKALSLLPPREADVIRLYFGLPDGEPETLEQIGVVLGVTRERVRQIRDKALSRLRTSQQAPILEALAS